MSEELDLLSDNRPIRYLERDADGEVVIYRASSVGACERALVASARREYAQPHPEWFQRVLDEGTANESVISGMWEEETGIPTVDQQREFNLYIGEIDDRRVFVRAHIDGMNGMDGLSIREYKKFRDSTWPKFLEQGVEVGANYPWQVSIAMHALDAEHFEAHGVHPENGIVVEFVGGHYHLMSGSDETDDAVREIVKVEPRFVANPPIPLKAIRQKIARVERLINTGFDAREVPCNVNMYPCPFYRIHDAKDARAAVELPPTDELYALMSQYNVERQLTATARKDMDSHDVVAKELRGRLIAAMTASGVVAGSDVTIGDHVVTWTESPRAAHEVKASVVTKVDIKLVDKPTVKKPTRKKAAK